MLAVLLVGKMSNTWQVSQRWFVNTFTLVVFCPVCVHYNSMFFFCGLHCFRDFATVISKKEEKKRERNLGPFGEWGPIFTRICFFFVFFF